MVSRLNLVLDQQEYEAIYHIARIELRNPADQARYMLRRELHELGLLASEQETAVSTKPQIEGEQDENHE